MILSGRRPCALDAALGLGRLGGARRKEVPVTGRPVAATLFRQPAIAAAIPSKSREPFDKFCQGDPQGLADHLQFDQVQATLPAFIFAHERLGTAKAHGHLDLPQPRLFPEGQEQVRQGFMTS
jgi:hypothetical protein